MNLSTGGASLSLTRGGETDRDELGVSRWTLKPVAGNEVYRDC